ncbi:hypothetical protein N7509_011744 [Penicillium cosmopolitanum]|uniref:Uncharacterized protein n=1 Tax=Penicillium cosmopolitanum TaxID=1131564 RepID=A0A9W9VGG0_9EURO|nr:uncharacterized protein N7509_011744 [Penicillium cosmopolitanum]KAJ5378625.1 hypothetical protein N7509_011744 [Penicillium cosmopolitanum]
MSSEYGPAKDDGIIVQRIPRTGALNSDPARSSQWPTARTERPLCRSTQEQEQQQQPASPVHDLG